MHAPRTLRASHATWRVLFATNEPGQSHASVSTSVLPRIKRDMARACLGRWIFCANAAAVPRLRCEARHCCNLACVGTHGTSVRASLRRGGGHMGESDVTVPRHNQLRHYWLACAGTWATGGFLVGLYEIAQLALSTDAPRSKQALVKENL